MMELYNSKHFFTKLNLKYSICVPWGVYSYWSTVKWAVQLKTGEGKLLYTTVNLSIPTVLLCVEERIKLYNTFYLSISTVCIPEGILSWIFTTVEKKNQTLIIDWAT